MKIGGSETLRLRRIEELFSLKGRLYGKAEFMNPAGSIKDRVAEALIDSYRSCGVLKEGGTLVEATSGNTGIALAMLGASRGYRVKITMPESASRERAELMRAYGAEVIFSEGKSGMVGATLLALEIAENSEGAVLMKQFENEVCVRTHYERTAPEIACGVGERIDAFVSGVGTGATLMGIGSFLKERYQTRIYAVEPMESQVLSGGKAAAHGIEGIGAGFVPPFYDPSITDGIIAISTEEAEEMARLLARREGILVGVSSGANLVAAIKIAKSKEWSIALPLADRGERYFSRGIFST